MVYRNVICTVCEFFVPDVQFEQAATSELEWLTEAERKLSCLGDIRLEPEQTTAQLQAQKVSCVFMWSSLGAGCCPRITETHSSAHCLKHTFSSRASPWTL